jgi:hypothetical protein
MKIAQVRLSYCMSWYDFNIDDPPEPILVWSNNARTLQSGISNINTDQPHLILNNVIEVSDFCTTLTRKQNYKTVERKAAGVCGSKFFLVHHEIRIPTSFTLLQKDDFWFNYWTALHTTSLLLFELVMLFGSILEFRDLSGEFHCNLVWTTTIDRSHSARSKRGGIMPRHCQGTNRTTPSFWKLKRRALQSV